MCDYCGREFDPISTRWLCPWCHCKANCCDGAPLPERDHTTEGSNGGRRRGYTLGMTTYATAKLSPKTDDEIAAAAQELKQKIRTLAHQGSMNTSVVLPSDETSTTAHNGARD